MLFFNPFLTKKIRPAYHFLNCEKTGLPFLNDKKTDLISFFEHLR